MATDYDLAVTPTPYKKFRVDNETWRRFGEVVGEQERSAEIRAFLEWRIENPDLELPRQIRKRRPRRAK